MPVTNASEHSPWWLDASKSDLDREFLRGKTPDASDLWNSEFAGINLVLWAKLLGIRKFIKGFYRIENTIYGYNTPVVQNGLGDPWMPIPKGDQPKKFGFYRVSAVDPEARDNLHLHVLLLDYSRGENSRLNPIRGLRDYIVQVDTDTYLGLAIYALAPLRLKTNYFLLERLAPGACPL